MLFESDLQVFEYLDMDLKKHMDDTESIYNNTNVGLDPSQNVLKGMKVIKWKFVHLCQYFIGYITIMHVSMNFDFTW